jgi:hypothetical protein
MNTTLAEQPLRISEFDYDIRDRNDAETWLAEVLPGAMRTPFEFTSDGNEIYAEDGGALTPIFRDAIVDAKRLAEKNPKLAFEVRRRKLEEGEKNDMLAMVRGELPNTMIIESDFPPELMHATKDVGGYDVTRKQTMLRVITYSHGRLKMYSQSLDGSNRQALEAIYTHYGLRPEAGELLGQRIHIDTAEENQPFVIDELTGVHDRNLSARLGGEWRAGRRDNRQNTYDFVCEQKDLIDRYVTKQQAGELTERERYNIAALMAERYGSTIEPTTDHFTREIIAAPHMQDLSWQLELAGDRAAATGRMFSGCGASAARANELSASEQLDEAGYGNKAETDDFGSLKFDCPKCKRTNKRPRNKLIPNCQKCGADVTC